MTFNSIRNTALRCANKFPFISPLVQLARKCTYSYRGIKQYMVAFPRVLGFDDPKYAKIKGFKNKYSGERCFIIATGPSLTIEDIEKLKNEHTFSMNSIALAYDKTDFRPDFLGVQDRNVYIRIYEELKRHSSEQTIIYADGLKSRGFLIDPEFDDYSERYKPDDSWVPVQVNGEYHMYDFNYTGKWHTKFHKNVYAFAYDGYSITYTLIQIAIFMGFKDIYLLGCDSSYSRDKDKQHFIESGHHDPERLRATAGDRFLSAYQAADKYAKRHWINIYNATRGGYLEVFPRVDLDEVLKTELQEKEAN